MLSKISTAYSLLPNETIRLSQSHSQSHHQLPLSFPLNSSNAFGHAFPLRNQNASVGKFSRIIPQQAKTQFPELSELEEKNTKNGSITFGTDGDLVQEVEAPQNITIKGILAQLMQSIDENEERRVISLGMGDPTLYSCFSTTPAAVEAVVDAVQAQKFNGYAPTVGLPQTRRAIAQYLSHDLPYKLSSDDVFITSGCTQAIDVALATLARPGANILIPRPGFPIYELCAAFRNIEVRHFDLLPENGWEVDLKAIEALADGNTVALVIINPGNPCGNVYSYNHLEKISETAKKLSLTVIADEVYGHLAFGSNPFVPMGVFGSNVPVLTLGSLSKRWIVPGWRLGWFVTTDPNGIYKTPKVVERTKKYFDILGGPATFIQAAVPHIIEQSEDVFFKKTIDILRQASDICFHRIKEIPCLTCSQKPEGSMAVMVKLNISLLEDISDDIDFCFKLAREESVILLPGTTVGLKNWLRFTFAADPPSIEEAFIRIKSFCERHSKKQAKILRSPTMEQVPITARVIA